MARGRDSDQTGSYRDRPGDNVLFPYLHSVALVNLTAVFLMVLAQVSNGALQCTIFYNARGAQYIYSKGVTYTNWVIHACRISIV